MSRNYGSLGGRRSGGGAWQWMVIGVIVGFGCSIIVGLAGIATGLLYLDVEGLPGRVTSTPIVQVITATAAPVTSTLTPTEVVVTETTFEVEQITAPTATPTTDPASIIVESSPTASPTTTSGSAQLTNAQGVPNAVPEALQGLTTPLIDIPGGTFEMGTSLAEIRTAVDECVADEGSCTVADGEDSFPPHQVTVNAFQIEANEVTYEQYMAFMNSMGPRSHLNGCNGQLCLATLNETDVSNVTFDSANYRVRPEINRFPVAGVTWYGAQAYCQAIGRRLPTEAEWERAARGNDGRRFPWGNNLDTNLAKTSRPLVDVTLRGAIEVGLYPGGSSPYGVLDMAGNVAEWTSDWYSGTYYNQPEASGLDRGGPPAGSEKVVRGGSWDTPPFFSRSMHRQSAPPDQQRIWLGFRCAADTETTTGESGINIDSPQGQIEIPPVGGSGDEETTANSQPTLPPPPGGSGTQPTLPPGG